MKLFGGDKPDHAMADSKEAQRLLESLPGDKPAQALEELTHWIESVSGTEGFRPEVRIERLLRIDEAAQPRIRALSREYLAAGRPSRAQETRMWSGIHDYWRQAGTAFARAVDAFLQNAKGVEAARNALPMLLCRALRSLAQELKWMHVRYGPVDFTVWGVFNSVYAFAELRGLADAAVELYPGELVTTTPRQEFLRALMFSASSPDSLLPPEAELAEQAIGNLAASFTLAKDAAPELPYWTDISQAMTPLRIARAPLASPGLRFVGAGSALETLRALIRKIETTDRIPPEANLRATSDTGLALQVLRHLATLWSPTPPERRHARHNVKSRLAVVHGFDGVLDALGAAGAALDAARKGMEHWVVENVSAGGFGAVVPQLMGDWLRIGALIAMQPEGGNNWVIGVVRRLSRTEERQARVGIETLSKAPLAARFSLVGANVEERGVLLRSPALEAGEALLVLRPGIFAPGQNLQSARGGRVHLYLPQGLTQHGEDYEIVRFREMLRER